MSKVLTVQTQGPAFSSQNSWESQQLDYNLCGGGGRGGEAAEQEDSRVLLAANLAYLVYSKLVRDSA